MIRSTPLRLLAGKRLVSVPRRFEATNRRPKAKGGFDEPFGDAYASGPSTHARHTQTRDCELPAATPHVLRSIRAKLGNISTIEPAHVHNLLNPTSPFHTTSIESLNRREREVLIHDLVDRGYALLAAKVMRASLAHRPTDALPKGNMFRRQLIGKVFRYATLPPGYNPIEDDRESPARLRPRGTADLVVLLPLLSSLQNVRHARPDRIYQYLLERLAGEGLYDTAAKMYVEQVEEWATEGRIAEGADPDSFYHGGGPPREGREEWELQSSLYKTWWKGVRTWTLPDEVLSPHDRLDLWHPRKLRLPEKLRKFPMPVPTSPPSTVPYPTTQNLAIILDRLRLDPDTAPPEAFERSMRACAILASTILSRTLPYLSARLLREVLGRTPLHPPVYPEEMTEIPDDESAWAYTAYTHIHLAIRSVLLSPPTIPALFDYMLAFDKAKSEGLPLPEVPPAYRYQTAPLNFTACVYLATYGLRKLRNAGSVRALIDFTQKIYGKINQGAFHNALLQGFTRLKEHGWAQSAVAALFRSTVLHPDTPLSEYSQPRRQITVPEKPPLIADDAQLVPDDTSLSGLLQYLVQTGQRDRFVDTVFRLMPHLDTHRLKDQDSSVEDVIDRVKEQELAGSAAAAPIQGDADKSDKGGVNGAEAKESEGKEEKEEFTFLTPVLYGNILHGCQVFRLASLSQRVYRTALRAEKYWQRHIPRRSNPNPNQQLGIQTFTSMIKLWSTLEKTMQMDAKQGKTSSPWDRWPFQQNLKDAPREIAAHLYIWSIYRNARTRWRREARKGGLRHFDLSQAKSIAPDMGFFNTLIRARGSAWGLVRGNDWSVGLTGGSEGHHLQPRAFEEMRIVAADIYEVGLDVPLALLIKLGLKAPLDPEAVAKMSAWEVKHLSWITNDTFNRPLKEDAKVNLDPAQITLEAELGSTAESTTDETVEAEAVTIWNDWNHSAKSIRWAKVQRRIRGQARSES